VQSEEAESSGVQSRSGVRAREAFLGAAISVGTGKDGAGEVAEVDGDANQDLVPGEMREKRLAEENFS
jgi:hypothetical protein